MGGNFLIYSTLGVFSVTLQNTSFSLQEVFQSSNSSLSKKLKQTTCCIVVNLWTVSKIKAGWQSARQT